MFVLFLISAFIASFGVFIAIFSVISAAKQIIRDNAPINSTIGDCVITLFACAISSICFFPLSNLLLSAVRVEIENFNTVIVIIATCAFFASYALYKSLDTPTETTDIDAIPQDEPQPLTDEENKKRINIATPLCVILIIALVAVSASYIQYRQEAQYRFERYDIVEEDLKSLINACVADKEIFPDIENELHALETLSTNDVLRLRGIYEDTFDEDVERTQSAQPPTPSQTKPPSQTIFYAPNYNSQPAEPVYGYSGNTDYEPLIDYVYIPRTGSCYHNNPNCSNMSNPSYVELSYAIIQGYDACSKCY